MIGATTRVEGEGDASRQTATMQLWGVGTDRGHVRAINEDTLVVEPELGLYAVLDGMGGAASGEVASRVAADMLIDCVRRDLGTQELHLRELLGLAIDAAAAAVYDVAANEDRHRGMGTTIVACLFGQARQVVIAHAGDSRAYLLRKDCMRQLTRDHTLWQEYADAGRVPSDENVRLKHILTQNLGDARGVVPEVLDLALEDDDRLLLCSDGLYEAVSCEQMRQLLGSAQTPDDIARQLIDLALNGPCSDNVSALVIAMTGPE